MPEPQKSSPLEEIFNSLPQTNLPETDIVEIPKYLSDTKKILDSFSRKDIPIVSDMVETLSTQLPSDVDLMKGMVKDIYHHHPATKAAKISQNQDVAEKIFQGLSPETIRAQLPPLSRYGQEYLRGEDPLGWDIAGKKIGGIFKEMAKFNVLKAALNLPGSVLKFLKTMLIGLPAYITRTSYHVGAYGEQAFEALGKAAEKGDGSVEIELKKILDESGGKLKQFGEGLIEANKPWVDLFLKGDAKALREYGENDPMMMSFDAASILGLGGLLTSATGKTARVAGQLTRVQTLIDEGAALEKIGAAMSFPKVASAARDMFVSLPAETLAKAPVVGKAIVKVQTKAKVSKVANALIRQLEGSSFVTDRLDVISQMERGERVYTAIKNLTPEELDTVIRTLEGISGIEIPRRVIPGKGRIVPSIKSIEKTFNEFTPAMREAYREFRALSLVNEDVAISHAPEIANALELRRYKPVMQKLGVPLKEAKLLFPDELSPVYWEHLVNPTWTDFTGVGTPGKTTIPALQKIGFLKEMKGSPQYITDNVPIITLGAMRRVRNQNILKRIDDFTKFGTPLAPGQAVREGYSSFNAGVLKRRIMFQNEAIDEVTNSLKKGAGHNIEVAFQAGRTIWGNITRRANEELFEGWSSGTVQVPTKVLNRFLEENPFIAFEHNKIGGLITKTLERSFDVFKNFFLFYNPAYYYGNALSNIGFALLAGARPKYVKMAFDKRIRGLVPTPLFGSMSAEERKIVTQFAKGDAVFPPQVEAYVAAANGEGAKALEMAKRYSYDPKFYGKIVDRFFDAKGRIPVYLTNLEKEVRHANLFGVGKKYQTMIGTLQDLNSSSAPKALIDASSKALDTTFDFFADYARLSPWERWVSKTGLLGFYPWLKFINKFAFVFPGKYPLRGQLLKNMATAYWQAQDKELAEWGITKDQIPIYIAGKPIIGMDEETGEAITISAPWFSPFASVLAVNEAYPIHPLAGLMLKSMFGVDPFTGKRTKIPHWTGHSYVVPYTGEVFTFDKEGEPQEMSKYKAGALRFLQAAWDAIPQTALIDGLFLEGAKLSQAFEPLINADKVINPATGQIRDEEQLLFHVRRFLGYPIQKIDLERILISEELTRRDAMRAIEKQIYTEFDLKDALENLRREEER